jgi:hypothetical protein
MHHSMAVRWLLVWIGLAAPASADSDRAAAAGQLAISTRQVGDGVRIVSEAAASDRWRIFAGGAAGPTLVEGIGTFGARVQILREATEGVSVYAGAYYTGAGHEGRSELVLSFLAQRHLGAQLLSVQVELGRELNEDQRDGDVALTLMRPLTSRLQVGVGGHARFDLDGGRDDGGDINLDASAGPLVSYSLKTAALMVQSGAATLVVPGATRAGGFALACVGGYF